MKKILTIIFDGFGSFDQQKGNAPLNADMFNYNNLIKNGSYTTLHAAGNYIGLNENEHGNSEIGHMTLGAGRLLKPRNVLVEEFLNNIDENNSPAIRKLLADNKKTVHIMALCSDGNIHSNINNVIKIYEYLVNNGFANIFFHLITDGKDVQTKSYYYISKIEAAINEKHIGSIATICGRTYAMDKEDNYDKTKVYYDLITKGAGIEIISIQKALESSYLKGLNDNNISPMLINKKGLIKSDDIVLWLNYRLDRSKQILNALKNPKFDKFDTLNISNLDIYSFFNQEKTIKAEVLLPEYNVDNSLGIYLSKLGLTQARVAEKEKFLHVTNFFDCGYDSKLEGMDKFNITAPDILSYDMVPEMNAVSVTKKVISCIKEDYDFILCNFANADTVGHTGSFEATTKACMTLDICLGQLMEAAESNFYTIILTSDHGNAEKMLNEDDTICSEHTLSDVPFIISDSKVKLKEGGSLVNVAPTILDYMDISIPEEMTGESLLIEEA